MSILTLLFIWLWIFSSLLSFGFALQYFQKEFPCIAEKNYESNFRFAIFLGLLGIIGLFVEICVGGTKHGLYPLRNLKYGNLR